MIEKFEKAETVMRGDEPERALFGKTLSDMKKVEAGRAQLNAEFRRDAESQFNQVAKLSALARQILGSAGFDKLIKLADSNKFRPLEVAEPSAIEINEENLLWANKTEFAEPTLAQMKDFVLNKKLIAAIIPRLLQEDGPQRIANLKELAEESPELVADLGKVFQAVELTELHSRNIAKLSARELERRAKVVWMENTLLKPVLN